MVTKGHICLNKSGIKGLKYKCFEKRDKFFKKNKKREGRDSATFQLEPSGYLLVQSQQLDMLEQVVSNRDTRMMSLRTTSMTSSSSVLLTYLLLCPNVSITDF